jgi:hypothetical protein
VALDRFVELIGAYWSENGFGDPTKAGSLKSSRAVKKAGPTPTPLVVYWSTRILSPPPLP